MAGFESSCCTEWRSTGALSPPVRLDGRVLRDHPKASSNGSGLWVATRRSAQQLSKRVQARSCAPG
jgi:hypothetical protein